MQRSGKSIHLNLSIPLTVSRRHRPCRRPRCIFRRLQSPPRRPQDFSTSARAPTGSTISVRRSNRANPPSVERCMPPDGRISDRRAPPVSSSRPSTAPSIPFSLPTQGRGFPTCTLSPPTTTELFQVSAQAKSTIQLQAAKNTLYNIQFGGTDGWATGDILLNISALPPTGGLSAFRTHINGFRAPIGDYVCGYRGYLFNACGRPRFVSSTAPASR